MDHQEYRCKFRGEETGGDICFYDIVACFIDGKVYSNPLFALSLLPKYVGFVYNVLCNVSALLSF